MKTTKDNPKALRIREYRQKQKKLPRVNCKFATRGCYSVIRIKPDGTQTILPLHCGRLECEWCSHPISHELRRNAEEAARTHGIQYNYTLTVPGRIPRAKQLTLLKKGRKALMSNLGSLRKQGLAYITCIGSGSENGRIHLHLFTNIDIWTRVKHGKSKSWLKPMWRKWTGGFAKRSQAPATPEHVANYAVGNIFQTVDWGRVDSSPLYTKSRNVQLRDRHTRTEDGSEWQVVGEPSAKLAARLGIVESYPVNTSFEVPVEKDALASFKSTKGGGVLCGDGAEGSGSTPATPDPVGASTVTGEDLDELPYG